MTKMRWTISASAGVILAFGGFGAFLPASEAPGVAEEEIDGEAIIRGSKLKAQYERWSKEYEQSGGNRRLAIAIGPTWRHAAEVKYGSGAVVINTIEGHVSARVRGLNAEQSWDLWLVDSVSDGDYEDSKTHLVGQLDPGKEGAALEADVGPDLFLRFQVDRVVVTRSGGNPVNDPELAGSASLFQRLYTALESDQTLLASDFTRYIKKIEPDSIGSILAVRSAIAAPIFIDGDTVFNVLVRTGSDLFFNQTFNGNGRTCGSCHPARNNLTIDTTFIDSLPDSDPLFAAEFTPALANNFENPVLMRGAGLIMENVDGMDNLASKFVMRGVPHTLGMSLSLTPTNIPFDNSAPPNTNFPPGFPAQRTGWGGDGAPNSGSLRDFATGAVNQHFPRTLNRVNGVDFRFPTSAELDAMEAFQLALGRTQELDLANIVFKNPRAAAGRDIFNRLDTGNPAGTPCNGSGPGCPRLPAGKCALCHNNAGANLNSPFFTAILGAPTTGNANFGTNTNGLAALPANLIDPLHNPRDGGFGIIPHNGTALPQIGNVACVPATGGFGVVTLPGGPLPGGLCEEDFNTPSLVEAADSGPFFHNNAVETIEAAVGFYNDTAFNNSAGGQFAASIDTNGIAIDLDTTQVTAIATMLRVVNALDNIRSVRELGAAAVLSTATRSRELTDVAVADAQDAIDVLREVKIHSDAVNALTAAIADLRFSQGSVTNAARQTAINTALSRMNTAEDDLIQ